MIDDKAPNTSPSGTSPVVAEVTIPAVTVPVVSGDGDIAAPGKGTSMPPPAHAIPAVPGTNAAAVADIATLVKAGAPVPTRAVTVSAGVVADITAAQRRNAINMLWEGTQAFLAIALTTATIATAFFYKGDIPSTLTNALFVVLGFYFGRTNPARPTAPTAPLTVGGDETLHPPAPAMPPPAE